MSVATDNLGLKNRFNVESSERKLDYLLNLNKMFDVDDQYFRQKLRKWKHMNFYNVTILEFYFLNFTLNLLNFLFFFYNL